MRFEKEVWTRYYQVCSQAKKDIRKAERLDLENCPKELKYELETRKVANIVELGVVEIPVKQIVGTATFDEKNLYSPDFLPVASADSPYAEQWCQLYMDYLSDKGWDGAIRCFEFLGRFYVQDGKKRVSVLKAHGATVTDAIVTRIMPVMEQDKEIENYYDFLNNYEKTGLYQVAFSQPGSFAKLQRALGHNPDYEWNDSDRFSFLFNLPPVEYALEDAFKGHLNITAADAMVTLLEEHSFNELRRMQHWNLTKLLQDSWVKLYKIVDPDFAAVPVGAA